MSANLDLEDVITDSVNDAVSGIDDTPDFSDNPETVDTPVEAASDGVAEATGEDLSTPTPSTQVVPTGNQTPPDPTTADPFEQLAGVSQMGITGRENRIPYSRVKKITEKAISEAETKFAENVLGRKLNQGEKFTDAVTSHVAQIPQLNEKVKDYEARLGSVGQFENIMANEPDQFLGMLTKLPAYEPQRVLGALSKNPAYKQFFDFVDQAYKTMTGEGQPPVTQPQANPMDGMPQPDEKLPDGSAVYSMKGLQSLITWTQTKAKDQAVADASRQFNERYENLQKQYKPMLDAWTNYQTRESVRPQIQAKIADAKANWPLFNELEEDITKVLEQDRSLSLEAAYNKVAFPRLIADRNTMRQGLIKELQAAPASTSATRPGSKPQAPVSGPQSLEEIIRSEVEKMGGR